MDGFEFRLALGDLIVQALRGGVPLEQVKAEIGIMLMMPDTVVPRAEVVRSRRRWRMRLSSKGE